jgi:hypothetical protein
MEPEQYSFAKLKYLIVNMKKTVLIICCLCTIGVSAQEKKKIVISPAPGFDGDKNVAQLFINHLGIGLTASGRYMVLENRKETAAISQEEQEAYNSGIVDDAQQVEFGHNEGADYACYVSIVYFAEIYDITCKFHHFSSGKLINSFNESAKKTEELIEAAKRIARRIASGNDFTSGPKLQWVKAPKCFYDERSEEYVDCDISISDEGLLSYEDAVNVCTNKGAGWRLPTKEELILIYYYRSEIEKEEGTVKFQKKDYWSSSKRNNYESFVINFATGKESHYSKNIKNPCRCIRYE